MKLKTNIARLLATGLLLNNIYFYSNANTLDDEIPGRYETLEGEYITIDDSMEGNLEEIEIFGNIVQNNNGSKNIFGSSLERGAISLHTGEPIDNNSLYRSADFDNIKPSTEYIVSVISGTSSGWIYYYDESYGFIHRQGYYSNSSFITPDNAHYFKIQPDGNCRYIQVEEGSKATSYTPYHKGDLSNIESVGELYLDENGNPILNNKGQRQYKIDIHSTTNLWSFVMDDWYEFANNYSDDPMYEYSDGKLRILRVDGRPWTSVPDIKVPKANTKYTFSSSDNSCTFAKTVQNPSARVSYISDDKGYIKGIKVFGDTDKEYDVKLVEGDYVDDISQASTTNVILPTQLQRVGDVADRLYWDNIKRKYVIEKNINEVFVENYERIDFGNKTAYFNLELGGCIPKANTPMFLEKFGLHMFNKNSVWNSVVFHDSWKKVILRPSPTHPTFEFTEDFLNSILPGRLYYQMENPLLIETNVTSKIKVSIYEGRAHVFMDKKNGTNPTLKVVIDRLPQIAKNAIEDAENNSTSYNISLARMYINMLPESLYKDQLQEQLSQVFSSDITLNRESASSNLDVYVKSENMLSISLDTNSITFDGYSGVDAMELTNAVNLTVNSSLPYDLNAYMPTEITNSNGSSTIDFDILNIKESSESTYQQFADTTNKVVLKSDCAKGNGNIHNIDLKLDSNAAHKADVYKTVIKFEAEQK